MSTEQNIAATRRLIDEGFTGGNLAICDELISPDALEHQRGSKAGIEGTKDTIRILRSSFSDFELTIVDLIAVTTRSGSAVVRRVSTRATSWADRRPAGHSTSRSSTSRASPTASSSSTGAFRINSGC